MATGDATSRVREIAAAQLGALLADRDVSGAHAIEGGSLEVMRRGRRERLEAGVDEELWAALRAAGASEAPVAVDLHPHRLRAAPVAGDRLLLHLEKAAPADPRLSDLVGEQLLPEVAADAVLRTAMAGNGLLVVGPARAAARRLAIAVGREVASHAPVIGLGGLVADWLLPAPALDDVVERARCAVDLGAEMLLSASLSLDDAVALARARLPVPTIAAVDVAGIAALYAAFAHADDDDVAVDALAGQVCVVGRAVSGRAVLLEQHAPAVGTAEGPVPSLPAAATPALLPAPAPARAPEVLEPAPAAEPPRALAPPLAEPPPDVAELPPLPPLPAGPPADWASSSPGEDPGWELGPRSGGDREPAPAEVDDDTAPFETVLAGVQKRPTFTPRPPPAHPQARQLQGEDPLGGLTLEPPPGDDDAGEGSPGGDG